MYKKKFLALLSLAALMGCSTTSLQCGVDGDSSYVNLTNLKPDLLQQIGYIEKLCLTKRTSGPSSR